jgi:hypothetical protein
MLRNLTLALIAAALLCALPAAAASNPVQPAAPSAPTACPLPAPLFDLAAPQPNSTPAPPAWRNEPSPAAPPIFYRGYCACECSTIKDCNKDADCSNNHCARTISCC